MTVPSESSAPDSGHTGGGPTRSGAPRGGAAGQGSAARWADLLDELGAADVGPGGAEVPTGGECAEALGQMFEYLDNELSDRTMAARIGEHVGMCTTCLAAYDTEKLVRAALVRSCRGETASVELRSRISVLIRAGAASRTT